MCDDAWGINDAQVVCRQVGCGNAQVAHQSAHFGEGTGQIMLDELRCSGNEANLAACSHRGFERHDCTHDEDAGVTCEGKCVYTQSAHCSR